MVCSSDIWEVNERRRKQAALVGSSVQDSANNVFQFFFGSIASLLLNKESVMDIEMRQSNQLTSKKSVVKSE